jgi:hypothetical protein
MKPSSMHNHEEPSPEPWITKQRLAEHLSVTTRWIELQQTRPAAHPHAWPEPSPHLGSRGVAPRAVRLATRPVDDFRQAAPRAPPGLSLSPSFAAIRRPTEYRGERLELAFLSRFRGACGPICGPHTASKPGFSPVETRCMPSRTHVCCSVDSGAGPSTSRRGRWHRSEGWPVSDFLHVQAQC